MQSFTSTNKEPEQWLAVVFFLFFFFAPYSVSSFFQHITPIPLSVIMTFGFVLIILTYIKLHPETRLFTPSATSSNEFWLLLAFALPALIASVAGAYNLLIMHSVEYQQFFTHALPRRLINLGLLLLAFWAGIRIIRLFTTSQLLFVTRGYVVSVIVIAWVGMWQLGHFLFGFPMIDLSTRSFVHSVQSDVLFNFRLTSIVDEPSYLAPLLIDGLIIGFIVYRDKWRYLIELAIPSSIVLLFSYSLSGYVNIVLIMLFLIIFLLFKQKKRKMKSYAAFLYGGLFLLLAAFVFRGWLIELLMPVIGRFETVFDLHRHSRLYMLVMPFVWLFDYSWVNSVFGFGPGSYQFLADTKFLHHQGRLSVTSNNVFVDLLFEHGMAGAIFFIVVYLKIGITFYKRSRIHIYGLYALLLWVHLGITSLYRSDFASPRLWVIILICFIFMEISKRNRHDLKKQE